MNHTFSKHFQTANGWKAGEGRGGEEGRGVERRRRGVGEGGGGINFSAAIEATKADNDVWGELGRDFKEVASSTSRSITCHVTQYQTHTHTQSHTVTHTVRHTVTHTVTHSHTVTHTDTPIVTN